MNQEPFTLSSMTVSDGHVTIEFVTEHPHHRHFTMGFRFGDSPALDAALEAVSAAAIPAAVQAMLEMIGDTSAPDTIAEVLPLWQCRICDAEAPAGTPGWDVVKALTTTDSAHPVIRVYCPAHSSEQH